MRFRLTLIDDRTGRPVDTRICNCPDREWVERRCAGILPRVALAKGIDVRHLRDDITELITPPRLGAPVHPFAAEAVP
jgi:hypothetical protein